MSLTIKDIARMANVSISTVSKIINGKDEAISEVTRNRVKDIIETYHYKPNAVARSMITKKTNTLGLIIPDIRNPFFTELARGCEDGAQENGYNIIFCNTDEKPDKEREYLKVLLDKRVDGIILTPTAHKKVQGKPFHLSVPLIVLDRETQYKPTAAHINIDNYEGAVKAVEYLIALGHQRIAYISGPIDIKPSIDRRRAIEDIMAKYQLPFDERDVKISEFTIEAGRETAKQFLKEAHGYTAFFCGNDLIATGFIQEMLANGVKIPDEISVVGFDDIDLASIIYPSLTTVRQPSYELGYQAAKLMIDLLSHDQDISTGNVQIKDVTLTTSLVVRKSTGENH